MHTLMCIYICIHISRERERENMWYLFRIFLRQGFTRAGITGMFLTRWQHFIKSSNTAFSLSLSLSSSVTLAPFFMVSVLFWKVGQLYLAQLFDLLIQIIKKGYASAASVAARICICLFRIVSFLSFIQCGGPARSSSCCHELCVLPSVFSSKFLCCLVLYAQCFNETDSGSCKLLLYLFNLHKSTY